MFPSAGYTLSGSLKLRVLTPVCLGFYCYVQMGSIIRGLRADTPIPARDRTGLFTVERIHPNNCD